MERQKIKMPTLQTDTNKQIGKDGTNSTKQDITVDQGASFVFFFVRDGENLSVSHLALNGKKI